MGRTVQPLYSESGGYDVNVTTLHWTIGPVWPTKLEQGALPRKSKRLVCNVSSHHHHHHHHHLISAHVVMIPSRYALRPVLAWSAASWMFYLRTMFWRWKLATALFNGWGWSENSVTFFRPSWGVQLHIWERPAVIKSRLHYSTEI
jgi:hypothetical protein